MRIVAERESLDTLLSALGDLMAWLASENVKGAIIGGVAVSLLSRPRFTWDVDAVVWLDEEHWAGFLSAGRAYGFVARRDDVLGFARDTRVLLLHHEPSGIDADVSFGSLPFEEEAIETASEFDIGGVRVRLPSPENLIVMKAVASRSRDLADIESLADAYPDLDVRKVRSYVREFARILEMPEIFERVDAILKRRTTSARSKKK